MKTRHGLLKSLLRSSEVELCISAADAIDALEKDAGAKQATIDRLMLEHCPGEMSSEQLKEWADHQKPASKVEAMLKHSRKALLQRKNKPIAKQAKDTFKTPNLNSTTPPVV